MRLIAEIDDRREEYTIPEGTVTLGRDLDCDIPLVSGSVSRRHIEIEYANGELTVRDLNSRNGTFVNDRPVEEALVRPGEVVRVGHVTLHFVRSGDLPAQPPPPGEDTEGLSDWSDAAMGDDEEPTPVSLPSIPAEDSVAHEAGTPENLPAVRGDQPTPSDPQAVVVGTRPLAQTVLTPKVRRALIAVLALTVVGIGIIWHRRHQEAQADAAGVMSVARYQSYINEAVEMVRDGRREEAIGLLARLGEYRTQPERFTARFFLAALRMDARMDERFADHWDDAISAWEALAADTASPEAARELAYTRIEEISSEARNMAAHDRALALLEEGKYVEFLERALDIDQDSPFATAINQRIIDARSRIRRELTEDAEGMASQGDWDEAIRTLRMIAQYAPDTRDEVERQIAEYEQYKEHRDTVASARRAVSREDPQAAERALERVPDDSPYAEERDALLAEAAEMRARSRAVTMYNRGRAEEALALLAEEGLGDSALAGRIEAVKELHESMERAIEEFRFGRADTAAGQIAERETDADNYYLRKAQEYLQDRDGFRRERAQALLDEARAAHREGEYAEARDKAESARMVYPRLVEAAQFIGVLRREAERIYNVEALQYRTTDPERALEAARRVRDLTRPGETFYMRADDLIKSLEAEMD